MDNDFKNMKLIIMLIAWMFILSVIYALITGCTKTVKHVVEVHDTAYVEKVRTDTFYRTEGKTDTVYKAYVDTIREYKVYRDSLVVRDSVYVKEKGDSVYVYKEKWRTQYVGKTDTLWRSKTDTVYQAKTDTVFVYKNAEARDSVMQSKDSSELKVKEKRNVWKHLGVIGVLLVLCAGIVWLIRRRGI